jgi:hypothetical protein
MVEIFSQTNILILMDLERYFLPKILERYFLPKILERYFLPKNLGDPNLVDLVSDLLHGG